MQGEVSRSTLPLTVHIRDFSHITEYSRIELRVG